MFINNSTQKYIFLSTIFDYFPIMRVYSFNLFLSSSLPLLIPSSKTKRESPLPQELPFSIYCRLLLLLGAETFQLVVLRRSDGDDRRVIARHHVGIVEVLGENFPAVFVGV